MLLTGHLARAANLLDNLPNMLVGLTIDCPHHDDLKSKRIYAIALGACSIFDQNHLNRT